MKLRNKIISVVSALSMALSLSAFTVANAADAPVLTITPSSTNVAAGEDVTLTIGYSGFEEPVVLTGIQFDVTFDEDYFTYKSHEINTDIASTAQMNYTSGIGVTYLWYDMSVGTGTTHISEASADLATVVLTAKEDFAAAEAASEISVANITINTVSNDYSDSDVTINSASILPAASITVAAEDATVVKGESTKVTATAANFAEAPTEFAWTVEGATSAATKVEGTGAEATLTIGADETASSVTVKATVGEVSGSTSVAVADKIYPLTVTADAFADNKTTINIAPTADQGYVAGTKYTVVAQFYTADGTASGYVELSDLADTQTIKVGSQAAAKVNVTISDESGTIIGRLEQHK